jgi:hypothetical protein
MNLPNDIGARGWVNPSVNSPPDLIIERRRCAMQANPVNVVVDIRQTINRERGEQLSSALGAMRGVSRAWVSPRNSRMLLVDYDPALIDSRQVLGTVARHGFDARLVGM